ncbi:MAG TPA: prolyl oligopeptidase family serine peptidase [Terriglobales bacterium]|nr:prolyl oligopeptidase family serine peptidase [Terriglobales bacterium]
MNTCGVIALKPKRAKARFFYSFLLLLLFFWTTCAAVEAQTNLKYQKPPQGIVDLVDVRPTPALEVSPGDGVEGRWVLIEAISGLPSIADLAQPELRLAGLRFNPKTNGPSRGRYITALSLKALPDGTERPVGGLPVDAKIRFVGWAPDARHFFFVNASDTPADAGLSLWIVDVATAQARRVLGLTLNAIFGRPCEWLGDSRSLICKAVPKGRGNAPARSEVPTGPVIQENLGRVTPGPTFQDLLKSPEDEAVFDYYATSQVVVVRLDDKIAPVGKPGVIEGASASPDGHYALLDERHHPYSYLLPFAMFPERISVVDLKTGNSRQLVDKPLEDTIPNIHDAVAAGPRDFEWRSDAPSTVFWVEAVDGGDPRVEASVRDRLLTLDAPFEELPRKLAELPLRFRSVEWGNGRVAIVEEERWKDRKRIMLAVSPAAQGAEVKLFEGSFEDHYHDPGRPFEVINEAGKPVARITPDGNGLYLRAEGASPEGDQPFVSVMSLANGESKRLWQSAAPFFEAPTAVLDAAAPTILIRRESPEISPNYYLKNLAKNSLEQVTRFPNPYGSAALPKKQVLKYKRADGVDLSANLYLPPGYKKEDGPLPTLMEAYPTEYKTKAAAGQISGSPYEFPFLYWGSPVPFATQGYAVLENATIPIVGEGQAEPNDTYVDQLVASAKAAIDEGARLGVVDRSRVAVMGHSYGAFMTANLLAHSDLFKAGIARSGAYNRTLTPFGFQNEDRTYWQAPEVYYKMSPFSYADKIKTPILLIHGEADNNTGTFPLQSERLFSAIKGQGGTVRFVLLPLESHGYAARESVLHMLWEMNNWLNTYVKNPPATAATQGATTFRAASW